MSDRSCDFLFLNAKYALCDEYYKNCMQSFEQCGRKIGWNWMQSEQTRFASDYVRQHPYHQTL